MCYNIYKYFATNEAAQRAHDRADTIGIGEYDGVVLMMTGVRLMMTGVRLMMTVRNVTDPLQGGKVTMLIWA